MKDLFVIVLLLAMVGLFFHDRQQTAQLDKAESDNAQLSLQLIDVQNQFKDLQARTRSTQLFQDSQPSSSSSQFQLKTDHLKDLGTDPLNRPAY